MRTNLSANAGNFTREPHVKMPHMQFTCVTCSLPVKKAPGPEYKRIAWSHM